MWLSLKSSLHRIAQTKSSRFLLFLVRRFGEAGISQTAGSLTFTTLLALIPLLTVMLVVITAFPMFGDVSASFMDFVHRTIVPSGASAVASYLDEFKMQAGKMTTIGVLAMMVTSIMLIHTIDATFNRIWRVQKQRSMLVRLPVYWGLLTLGPIFVGVSLSASASLLHFGQAVEPNWFASSLQSLVQNVLNALILLLFYYGVPNCYVPLRHAAMGASVASVLFTLAKYGFGLYISNFNSYTLIYGAFATIPIFLIWLNLVWTIILGGALIAASISDWQSVPPEQQPNHSFNDAVDLLLLLTQAQTQGKALEIRELQQQTALNRPQLTRLLNQLVQRDYVAHSEKGWLLQTAPNRILLSDLFTLFVYDYAHASHTELQRVMAQCTQPLNMSLADLHRAATEKSGYGGDTPCS